MHLKLTPPLISFSKNFAFSTAWFNASTLDVCPTPLEISLLFFTNTIAFDFEFLQTLDAKIKSSISFSDGFLIVTIFSFSMVSIFVSFS